ncbi:MAG: hypothetical protein BMS9Abin13_650 [Patescibacteria group bacterium]|nr:MAG: hypothetical protein BMS9Abin13_650 [Patescibacteria group bacterium]
MTKTSINTKVKGIDESTQKQVIGVFREIMSDPDFGLPLKRGALERLKRSVLSQKAGKYKELSEVL